EVVLDDAVVDEDDLAGAMRMRVLLRGPAVRRPARVADARRARERLLAEQRLQVVELADAAANLDVVVGEGGEARGVVAAVLELPEAAHDDGPCLTRADVADDPAHDQRLRRARATARGFVRRRGFAFFGSGAAGPLPFPEVPAARARRRAV